MPILQIVYETLKDLEEGKGGKMLTKAHGKYKRQLCTVQTVEVFINLRENNETNAIVPF